MLDSNILHFEYVAILAGLIGFELLDLFVPMMCWLKWDLKVPGGFMV